MVEQIELPSIRDKDLRIVLEYYGIGQSLKDGNEKCIMCGEVITWDNIGAIKVTGGKLILICGSPEWLEELD